MRDLRQPLFCPHPPALGRGHVLSAALEALWPAGVGRTWGHVPYIGPTDAWALRPQEGAIRRASWKQQHTGNSAPGASDMQVHEVMCSQGEKSCHRQEGWELGSHAYRLTASSGPLLSLQGPGGGGGTTQA